MIGRLSSDSGGLASEDAAARLARNGPNELITRAGPGIWVLVGSQFRSVLVLLLLVSAAVSAVLGDWIDSAAIATIVMLNAGIGAYQEYSAEKSIAALRQMSSPRAKVRRVINGQSTVVVVDAAHVVAGDVLTLEAGDLVAADARVISAASLSCIEKTLTGESEPSEKQTLELTDVDATLACRTNMVYMGTAVATGTGAAVVVATGMESEVGGIAGLIAESGRNKSTPLQDRISAVSGLLVKASLAIVAVMFAIGLLRGQPLLELFLTAVSLAVAAVPEGLPAVVTVSMALGVRRMARRRALIRRMPAVETLGCTSVICTDKTGTLTAGQMTARVLWSRGVAVDVRGEGYGPEGDVMVQGRAADEADREQLRPLAENLFGCNNAAVILREDDGGTKGDKSEGVGPGVAWDAVGDPTEAAMLVAGVKLRLTAIDRESIDRLHPKVYELPFDSDRKRSSVVRSWGEPGAARVQCNGAPGGVLSLCDHVLRPEGLRPMGQADRDQILATNSELAGRGLRVLACARRDMQLATGAPRSLSDQIEWFEKELVFVGLVGMYDPPRAEAKKAIVQCQEAGIRVVMITGDQPRTAVAIAEDLGLFAPGAAQQPQVGPSRVVLAGAEVVKLSDAELEAEVGRIVVYARVTAADKLRIVRSLRASGAVVAMTGDGVNDAPALRGADVGVAMGRSGTEVARQAADMIVTDDNFASIVSAVEQGRGVYDNIRKTMLFLLGTNGAELLLMAVCMVAGLPAPLLPVQLLWINLVTDGLPALVLAADPVAHDVMRRRPRAKAARIMDRPFLIAMGVTSLLTAAVAMAAYMYGIMYGDEKTARTFAFATLVVSQLLLSLGCRSETRPLWRLGVRSNLMLPGVVLGTILLQLCVHRSETLAGIMKTTTLGWGQCAALFALAAVPLLVLEVRKAIRPGWSILHVSKLRR